jgi:hypothetical protein
LAVEVDSTFVHDYLAGKFEPGRVYDVSAFQNENEYLNAKLEWKRQNNYDPPDPDGFNAKILSSPTMRSLLVAIFNQIDERGLVWVHLIGAKLTFYSQETSQGTKYFVKIFGHTGLPDIVKETGYQVCGKNSVKALTMGFGSFKDAAKYAAEDLASSVNIKAVSGRWMFIGFLVETGAWMAEGGEDVEELVATLIPTAISTAFTMAIAPLVSTVIVGITGAASASALALAIGGAAVVIVVGLGIGWALDKLGVKDFIYKHMKEMDKFYEGMTQEEKYWFNFGTSMNIGTSLPL